MIDLSQWRVRIGSWSCSKWLKAHHGDGLTIFGTGALKLSATRFCVFATLFSLGLLLIISGDIEQNPGPTLTGIIVFYYTAITKTHRKTNTR